MAKSHRLKEARENAGISQYELARRLGLKQPTVATQEGRDDVRISTIVAWAEALEVEPADLIAWPRKAGKAKRK